MNATVMAAPFASGAGVRARVLAGVDDWLLLGFLFFLPVQVPLTSSFRIAPSDLFLFGWFAVTGARLNLVRAAWSAWHVAFVLVFLGGIVIGGLRIGYLGTYALINKGFGMFVLLASYAMLTHAASDWDRLRAMLRAFVLTVVLHVALALVAYFVAIFAGFRAPGINYGSGAGMRLSGMLVDPNAFGGLVVMSLVIVLIASQAAPPILTRRAGTALGALLAVGALLTFSRSAWLGLALALSALAAVRFSAGAKLFGILIAAGLAGLIMLGADAAEIIIRMATRSSQIADRLHFISAAVEAVERHPVIGTGIGYFFETHGYIIHNTMFWLLAETGLVGVTVFAGLSLWFLSRGWIAYRLADAGSRPIVLALVGAFLAMLGLTAGIEALYQRHWWMVMGLLAAAYRLALRDGRAREATT